MTLHEFWRYHFLKTILAIVFIQIAIFAWLQYRNHRPIAQADESSVFENHSVRIPILRNDSDKDEDELTIQYIASPLQGTIISSTNSIEYKSKRGFVGVDSFLYAVSDGKKLSKKTFIKITVNKNLPPVAHGDEIVIYAGTTAKINPIDNDTDREEDSIYIQDFKQSVHGKLTKTGDQFEYIPSGSSVEKDSFQYTLSDQLNLSEPATVIITVKGKNDPAYPWLARDIGNTNLKGSFSPIGNNYIIKASGNDIWGNSDDFQFAYQSVTGNFEMMAKIESLDNTNEWAKSGIMAREKLSGTSRHIIICMTSQHGLDVISRKEQGGSSISAGIGNSETPPYWLKLARKGNTFISSSSANGSNWKERNRQELDLSKELYWGLAVTSHNNDTLAASVYDKNSVKIFSNGK